MAFPSIMRCSIATAGIAANLGIGYSSFMRGYFMVVWFKSRAEKAEFFRKLDALLKWEKQ